MDSFQWVCCSQSADSPPSPLKIFHISGVAIFISWDIYITVIRWRFLRNNECVYCYRFLTQHYLGALTIVLHLNDASSDLKKYYIELFSFEIIYFMRL